MPVELGVSNNIIYIGNGTGLRAQYFNATINAAPIYAVPTSLALVRIDGRVDFNWGTTIPVAGITSSNAYFVRWQGRVQAITDGVYTFSTENDDGVRLWINGENLIEDWSPHSVQTKIANRTLYLVAGRKYDIRLEYFQGQCCGAIVRLKWAYPGVSAQIIPSAQLYPTTTPDTIGIWRPSNRTFYLKNANSTGFADYEVFVSFAQTTDLPVVGDWDGDGRDSVGVYRPTNGWFYLINDITEPSTINYAFQAVSSNPQDHLPFSVRASADSLRDGVGLLKKTNGTYTIYPNVSNGGAGAFGAWGLPGDVPMWGNWLVQPPREFDAIGTELIETFENKER